MKQTKRPAGFHHRRDMTAERPMTSSKYALHDTRRENDRLAIGQSIISDGVAY